MKNLLRSNKGSALIAVMIVLLVLTVIAAGSILNSTTNMKTGKNYSESISVFNLAEVGLAKAKLILKNTVNFSDLLNQHSSSPLIPMTTDEAGSYQVHIENNIDQDTAGNETTDMDSIVILKSKAIGPTGAKVELVAHVGRPSTIDIPPIEAALAACGVFKKLDLKGNSFIDGHDWSLPTTFGCKSSGKNSSSGDDDDDNDDGKGKGKGKHKDKFMDNISNFFSPISTAWAAKPSRCDETLVSPETGYYGIVSNSDVSLQLSSSDLDHLSGFIDQYWVNPDLPCEELRNLALRLSAMGAGPGVEIVNDHNISGHKTLGTRDNPQLTIVSTDGNVHLSGNAEGAGVLVIALGSGEFKVTGNLYYEGIVIVLGGRSKLKLTGNSKIMGSLITTPTGYETPDEVRKIEFDATGNSDLKYSSEAIEAARLALGNAGAGGGSGQLVTLNWQENY